LILADTEEGAEKRTTGDETVIKALANREKDV
jgi:hypothetical protein